METVEFSVRKICTTEVTDRIYWNGLFDGPEVNVARKKCLPIHPLIELNPPNGMSKYYFDAQLIRDIGVDLQLHSTATASSSSNMDTSLKRKCFHCNKQIPLDKMRVHVASHIMHDDISGLDVCGFCGKEGCDTQVTFTSKKSNNKFFKISQSDYCAYNFDYVKKKAYGKNNRSTNRLIYCEVRGCTSVVWMYNLSKHYTRLSTKILICQT